LAGSTSIPKDCCCSPMMAGLRGYWNCRQPAGLRRYRVRALGRVQQELDRLRGGITIDGVRYGPIEATLDREQGANVWLTFGIREGKNARCARFLNRWGSQLTGSSRRVWAIRPRRPRRRRSEGSRDV
jgi:hypothetical protein